MCIRDSKGSGRDDGDSYSEPVPMSATTGSITKVSDVVVGGLADGEVVSADQGEEPVARPHDWSPVRICRPSSRSRACQTVWYEAASTQTSWG